MKENSSVIFNKGYIAGYNQARVDNGSMTRKEADDIQIKLDAKKGKAFKISWEDIPSLLKTKSHRHTNICPITKKQFERRSEDDNLPSLLQRIGGPVYCSECGGYLMC